MDMSVIFRRIRPLMLVGEKMSTFVSTVNPVTGKTDWIIQNDMYDYHQEIARSAYADMLHDTERNKKYYQALESAIRIKRGQGEKVNVLDIGTGTGLLSMMAAKLGADSVTACEAFKPMADCARLIIKDNGFEDKIRLVPKRSTDVTVGAGGDMPQRANILVTEVFDTELIGEGAIRTFTHAHAHLLEDDCIVVPSLAFMYVQLVSSDFIRRWREILPVEFPASSKINFPKKISECTGAPSLHDLQMDQIPQDKFQVICDPVKVFRFDFTGKQPLPKEEQSGVVVTSKVDGKVDGVFMWWELQMDTQGDIMLSCAPSWAHPNIEELQWRDHWMQAVYYPSIPLKVNKGEEVKVLSNHDEYSLWFNVEKECSTENNNNVTSGPVCTCGAHITYSRNRLGMMNDPVRQSLYKSVLSKRMKTTGSGSCLVYSSGSILPLLAAQAGFNEIFVIEPNPMCHKLLQSFVEENNFQEKIQMICKEVDAVTPQDLNEKKLDLVIGEPYFESSVLPWHHIAFWYGAEQLTNQMADNSSVLPFAITIKAVAVEFKDLWKIRAPVGVCEGFDISRFDKLIESSSSIADAVIEPQPLWEYPCTARSKSVSLFHLSYKEFCTKKEVFENSVELALSSSEGQCNGVVLWAEFDFGEDQSVTTGPVTDLQNGQKVQWDFYSKQGIHLLKRRISCLNSCAETIKVSVKFTKDDGDFSFSFS